MLHWIHHVLVWLANDIELWHAANVVAAAGLGSSFYVLIKSQPYLVNRSFDPKYNAIYTLRFIVGVIGGVILSTVFGTWLDSLTKASVVAFTPGMFALLGGYASEAVEQILQRVVDVLLTAVRGDGSAEAQAKAAATQAAKDLALNDLLPELEDAQNDVPKFKETLQKIRTMLVKPGN